MLERNNLWGLLQAVCHLHLQLCSEGTIARVSHVDLIPSSSQGELNVPQQYSKENALISLTGL